MPNVTREEFLRLAKQETVGNDTLAGVGLAKVNSNLQVPGMTGDNGPFLPDERTQPSTSFPVPVLEPIDLSRQKRLLRPDVRQRRPNTPPGILEGGFRSSRAVEVRVVHGVRPIAGVTSGADESGYTESGAANRPVRFYQGAEEAPAGAKPKDPCPPEEVTAKIAELLGDLFSAIHGAYEDPNESKAAKKERATKELRELHRKCPEIAGKLLREAEKDTVQPDEYKTVLARIQTASNSPAELLRRILERREEVTAEDSGPIWPEEEWGKRPPTKEVRYAISAWDACLWLPMVRALRDNCRKEANALTPRLQAICDQGEWESKRTKSEEPDEGKGGAIARRAIEARVGLSADVEALANCLKNSGGERK